MISIKFQIRTCWSSCEKRNHLDPKKTQCIIGGPRLEMCIFHVSVNLGCSIYNEDFWPSIFWVPPKITGKAKKLGYLKKCEIYFSPLSKRCCKYHSHSQHKRSPNLQMKYSSVCEFQFLNKEPALCPLWCVNLKAAISFKNLLKNKDLFYFPIPVAHLAVIFLLGNKFHWDW
jgi:hypothetical protein